MKLETRIPSDSLGTFPTRNSQKLVNMGNIRKFCRNVFDANSSCNLAIVIAVQTGLVLPIVSTK